MFMNHTIPSATRAGMLGRVDVRVVCALLRKTPVDWPTKNLSVCAALSKFIAELNDVATASVKNSWGHRQPAPSPDKSCPASEKAEARQAKPQNVASSSVA